MTIPIPETLGNTELDGIRKKLTTDLRGLGREEGRCGGGLRWCELRTRNVDQGFLTWSERTRLSDALAGSRDLRLLTQASFRREIAKQTFPK